MGGETDKVVVQGSASPEIPKANKYAIGCSLLGSMTSMLMGYDIGVMSGATIFIQEQFHLSDVRLELLAGLLSIYSLVGAAFAGRTSDMVGRRYTIVVAGCFFFAGAILMGFATNYAFLMVGRFVAGIGVGFAMMISPVYTAEVAPASMRGFLTSFTEVFVNVGILLGYVSNYVFARLPPHLGWRFMLGVGAVPSVLITLGVLAMPESPRWLVMQGRLGEAKRVLEKVSVSEKEAQQRLAGIKEAADIPLDCDSEIIELPKKESHGAGVWREMFVHPSPAVRHILICAIGMHFFQQVSGIDAVVLYSPRIFAKAGISSSKGSLLATVGVGLVKTLAIFIATFLLDKKGRRPLLLTSVLCMFAALVTLGTCLTVIHYSQQKLTAALGLSIAMVYFYVASFSVGIGPMVYVYCSEIFPLRLRAQGMGLGIAVNRLFSGIISISFLSLYHAITIGGAFFLFAGIVFVSFVFFFSWCPETKGRSLEDIEGLFGKLWGWRYAVKEEQKKGGEA
ncbi:hypothetical protein K2173_013555 [Erythroxylum novogranatense]|uniref:Major facilitator superfamily (MFS) profile domain-containing protein n=1 Tax=Erythroxylum novogranatense TaxID=1862640 RepID=A0AAV8TK98_9ROSI|nr:hypothetical protein K2173_013555 [Erythroxylum novogranatense]